MTDITENYMVRVCELTDALQEYADRVFFKSPADREMFNARIFLRLRRIKLALERAALAEQTKGATCDE